MRDSGKTMLEELISRAAKELQGREKARDEALNRARKARQLSKQAILFDHIKQHDKASSNLAIAHNLLEEAKSYIQTYPELGYYEEVEAALEEHAESQILHSLLINNKYPSPEQVGVTPTRYLLGLGDIPGELRREALDALRVGSLEDAQAHLNRMEEIYLNLVAMEDASLLKGLRRKLDVARGVIEATRGEITAEAGRKRLSASIEKIGEKLN